MDRSGSPSAALNSSGPGNNIASAVHKQFVRNQKAMKQAKGMIYAAQGAASQSRPGDDSPHKMSGVMINSGLLQGKIGRSLSNERGTNAWGGVGVAATN